MNFKFYDTCSLLLKGEEAFLESDNIQVVVSSITIQELEEIKTSRHKDESIKKQARTVVRALDTYSHIVHIYKPSMLDCFKETDFEINNDLKILATAYDFICYEQPQTIFYTNDKTLKIIAHILLKPENIKSVNEKFQKYQGYKELQLATEQIEEFYCNLDQNLYNLLPNEYLIIRNADGELIDKLCWTGSFHRPIKYTNFDSIQFGKIKPFKGDVYQALALDSIISNQITMICGKAGAGKTFLSFGCLFHLLERGAIDQIVVFCNPVVAKDAAKLGYYPGSKLEKLMGSQVGAVLASKLGSEMEVEKLVSANRLILVPAGDARGYEVPARSGVYVMEAQNLTKDLLRMILQRISEDCKVIIDGDYEEQVDLEAYAGDNNGMIKMSEVFRGYDFYGQVELQNIHRSRIAQVAELMK